MTLKYRSVPAAARSRGVCTPLTGSFRSSDFGVDHRTESRSWRIGPDSKRVGRCADRSEPDEFRRRGRILAGLDPVGLAGGD